MRAWRSRYQHLDDALRDAVIRRDQRLVELGEAAFLMRADLDSETEAFAQTVDDLEVDVSAAQVAVREAETALSDARHARAARLEACKSAVDVARNALVLPERDLSSRVVRRDTLEREVEGVGVRQGEARARCVRLDDRLARLSDDDEERGPIVAQREQAIATIEALGVRGGEVRVEHAAALVELAPLQAKVDVLVATHSEALDALRAGRQAGDAAVKAGEAEQQAGVNRHEQRVRRRKAVIVDLARAVLRVPDVALPERQAAEEAIVAIETLRNARSVIDAERQAYDGSAARRTAYGVGGLLLALIILWIAL
ncbi:MAG: hypothetical protein ACI9U2_000048 [Bradymonadia bacterium]|jgi:hypothetical protein